MQNSAANDDGSGLKWRGGAEGGARRRFGESHMTSDLMGQHDEPFRTAHFSIRPLSISPLEKQRLESDNFRDSGTIQSDPRPLSPELGPFSPDSKSRNRDRYPPYDSRVTQDPTRGEPGTTGPTHGRSRHPPTFGPGFNSGPGQGFGPGYNGRQNSGHNSGYNVYNTGYSGGYNTGPSSGIRGWYDRFLGGMSGGYGDKEQCDCVAYNLLGLGTAAATSAALAALLLFANLTNVGRSLENEWTLGVEVLDLTSLLAEPFDALARGEGVVWDGSDPRSAFGRMIHQLPDGVIQRSLLDLAGWLKPRAMTGVAVRTICYASGYRGQDSGQNGTASIRGRFLERIGIVARDGEQRDNYNLIFKPGVSFKALQN